MKGQQRNLTIFLFIIAALAVLLTGCKSNIPLVSEISDTKAYTLPQSMVILTTERNRYQKLYTSQIWGVDLPEGQTFESYLKKQVKEFLQEMHMMNQLAEEKGITFTGSEKEEIRKATEEYFSSLSADDIAYMGVSKADVKTMYEEYYRSNKVVVELTKDMNLEISDSEAKVIVVQQIVLTDQETAKEVLLKAENTENDFSSLAREYSEDDIIERNVLRGENKGAYEDAAFALSTGEISQLVKENESYYIIKCVNDYDEIATQERKAGLFKKRKKEAFDQIYSRFKQENPVTFQNDLWKKTKFSKDDKTTTDRFFEIYKKHFPD
ncbi:peptidylprolyl isomerase [Clostridium sp. E02]|uniref:peptidylprolyl isomerase n=1 Tax=Clostridium sp. E02 TaxID=2487134 RepID=UPI000F53623D|nr:peptidylprolyl isomerase [Clostridium sp. E02]